MTEQVLTYRRILGVIVLSILSAASSPASIFLPCDAIEQERMAASELAAYLGRITGGTWPVVHEMSANVVFVVGRSPAIDALLDGVAFNALGGDGIVMRTVDGRLVLSGGQPRGTRNAVYTFLEEHLGVRWWTRTEETVPRRDELPTLELDVVYRPPFDFRAVISQGAGRKPYAFKLRNNGPESKFDPDGESILRYLLPWRTHFVEHPEWYMYDPEPGDLKRKYTFSMGLDQLEERSEARAVATRTRRLPYQPCMTSEGALAAATEAAMKRLQEQYPLMADYPPRVLWIVQQDGRWMCKCDDCNAVRRLEGSDSANWIRFVNFIADRVRQRYPDVLVGMHAYLHTGEPPLTVRPRDNVLIYMASLDRDHGKDFGQLVNGQRLKQWCRIAKHVWVWDYDANFRNYIMPHPNHLVTTRTIRLCAEAGATGYRCQGALGEWSDLVYMRGWVNTRLAWDPTLDPDALRQEYLDGYFGPAGPFLQRYLVTLQRLLGDRFLSCYSTTTESWLDLEGLNELTAIFKEAAAAVAHDATFARRLKTARRSLDVVWLERYHGLKAEAQAKAKEDKGQRGQTSAGPRGRGPGDGPLAAPLPRLHGSCDSWDGYRPLTGPWPPAKGQTSRPAPRRRPRGQTSGPPSTVARHRQAHTDRRRHHIGRPERPRRASARRATVPTTSTTPEASADSSWIVWRTCAAASAGSRSASRPR